MQKLFLNPIKNFLFLGLQLDFNNPKYIRLLIKLVNKRELSLNLTSFHHRDPSRNATVTAVACQGVVPQAALHADTCDHVDSVVGCGSLRFRDCGGSGSNPSKTFLNESSSSWATISFQFQGPPVSSPSKY